MRGYMRLCSFDLSLPVQWCVAAWDCAQLICLCRCSDAWLHVADIKRENIRRTWRSLSSATHHHSMLTLVSLFSTTAKETLSCLIQQRCFSNHLNRRSPAKNLYCDVLALNCSTYWLSLCRIIQCHHTLTSIFLQNVFFTFVLRLAHLTENTRQVKGQHTYKSSNRQMSRRVVPLCCQHFLWRDILSHSYDNYNGGSCSVFVVHSFCEESDITQLSLLKNIWLVHVYEFCFCWLFYCMHIVTSTFNNRLLIQTVSYCML